MWKVVYAVATVTAGITVTSCREDNVYLPVTVIVPAEIASLSPAELRLSLWTYDPSLADAPATLVDADSVRFSHVPGTQDRFRMHVEGRIPEGFRHYISVRGFELTPQCENYVL